LDFSSIWKGGLCIKNGHIPGAYSLWRCFLGKDNPTLMKSDEELRELVGQIQHHI
jgi:hypothetical protein